MQGPTPPAAAPTAMPGSGPMLVTVPAGGTKRQASVVITPPMSAEAVQAWGRMRRRVDVVRSGTGRVATVAGAVAAVTTVAFPGAFWPALGATAALTAVGAGILRLQMPFAGHQKATATVLYVVPGAALGAVLIAERLAAGAAWGGTLALQVAAALVWAAGTWLLRPARVARRMATPPPPPAPEPTVDLVAVDAHPAAQWWAANVAIEGGVAPATVLEAIERTGETAMTAIIRSAVPGQPVPEISTRRLSALMDVPKDDIRITSVPGRGEGVQRLAIGTADAAETTDPATVWAERIAPVAMPGAVLTGVRTGRPGAPAVPTVQLTKNPTAEDAAEDAPAPSGEDA